MMASQAKKELDPEELMNQKFRARCRFRAFGRLVLANAYWLIEDVDYYEGIDNVQLRVQQAVRTKAKKQLLRITDKALLNKKADERTETEKKYIYRMIGGLKCFKRYPHNVKKKLAALTYYKYYGPGRVIVRQHQEAHALYFIVSGDITVSQTIYDELLKQYISVDVGSMHAGDMFGEVSLLHNIPRTATCTAAGHCELLALMKDDFKNVLQASVQKQWDEVLNAMSTFTYFDALDEVARREGCIVAKMKSYEPNETILGDGVGVPNFVYFLLKGRCQMIESLQVTVHSHLQKTSYKLYDPYVPPEESDQDFEEKYFGAYRKKNNESKDEENESFEQEETELKKVSMSKGSILKQEGSRYSKNVSLSEKIGRDCRESIFMDPNSGAQNITSDLTRDQTSGLERKNQNDLRTYFMQVCQFNPGSTFGFGENMRDRRIVALTPVQCMLLPKIWLLQRNTANIWTRIQHYLERKIPTKKQLFKEFVNSRKWHEFREQVVTDIVSRTNTVNWTTVHDVPYSIRMEEMLDI